MKFIYMQVSMLSVIQNQLSSQRGWRLHQQHLFAIEKQFAAVQLVDDAYAID